MTDQKRPLCQVSGFKVYLLKDKSNLDQVKIKIEKKGALIPKTYSKIFTCFEDIPYSIQKYFHSIENFTLGIQSIFTQKNVADLVSIDNNMSMNLKLKLMMGKYQILHNIKIKLLQDKSEIQTLSNRIADLEKRLAQFMGEKDKEKEKQREREKQKVKEKNHAKDILDQIISKRKQKEDKITQKQKQKKNSKDQLSFEQKQTPTIKPFKIQDKKVTILDSVHQIEASLISKQGLTLISVSVQILKTKLTYIGELNDTEIEEFLFEATKIKNSTQLFEEIKKNARKQNRQTLKVNERENKLEILINVPTPNDKFMTSEGEKQESIFAEIDIRPIKQEHREEKNTEKSNALKSSKKKFQTSKEFDTRSSRSLNPNMTKQALINNVKQSLLSDSKSKKKGSVYSSFQQVSKSSRKKKNNSKENDKLSEISFQTKNTVQKLKQGKASSKSKKRGKSFDDLDEDFNLSFSHPVRSKSRK